jgi:hypothetical protein
MGWRGIAPCRAMERQGFNVNPTEWWHFDYFDYKEWQQYPILNVKFEDLVHRRFSPPLNAVDID